MKKFFAIPLAVLILISAMHVTIATHFCGGEIAATTLSLSGKTASCGMTHELKSGTSALASISSNCCRNEITVYSVDNNYAPAAFHFKEITRNIIHEYAFPEGFTIHANYQPFTRPANVSPPGNSLASAVSMADICVFRI